MAPGAGNGWLELAALTIGCVFFQQVIEAKLRDSRHYDLQVIVEADEGVIVILGVFGQDEIVDGELSKAMLLWTWFCGQCGEQLLTQRCRPFGGVQVEELGMPCLLLELVGVSL